MRLPAFAIAFGLAASAPAAADDLPPLGSTDRANWNPACRAVTNAKSGPRDVGFRLRCNFVLEGFVIRTSRALARVRDRPRIESRRERDRLRCRKRAQRRGRCSGEVSSRARIIGAFAVSGDPCNGLVTRFDAFGGVCTSDGEYACPQVAFHATVTDEHPRGC